MFEQEEDFSFWFSVLRSVCPVMRLGSSFTCTVAHGFVCGDEEADMFVSFRLLGCLPYDDRAGGRGARLFPAVFLHVFDGSVHCSVHRLDESKRVEERADEIGTRETPSF